MFDFLYMILFKAIFHRFNLLRAYFWTSLAWLGLIKFRKSKLFVVTPLTPLFENLLEVSLSCQSFIKWKLLLLHLGAYKIEHFISS